MRCNILFFLLVFLLSHLPIFAVEQTSVGVLKETSDVLKYQRVPTPAAIQQKIKNYTLDAGGGSEFFCMLPPNDPTGVAALGNLAIYVCAGTDCSPTKTVNVKVYRGTSLTSIADFELTRPSEAVALTAAGGSGVAGGKAVLQGTWEVLRTRAEMSSNRVWSDKALRVVTEGGDVFVYVGSFSNATAEGYMVLPTHLLGDRYIHCSREDANDRGDTQEFPVTSGPAEGDFRTGFSCIAAFDGTMITATLRSRLPAICISYDRQPANGTTTLRSPTMRQNELWNVVNGINGSMNGVCDFTGTLVTGTKPFAMVSWVQRTGIPVVFNGRGIGHGRDNLVEQLLPVKFWGKEFISVQFKGSYEESSNWSDPSYTYHQRNPGNIYRVVASERNTRFDAKCYSLDNMTLIYQWGESLRDVGSWEEYDKGTFPAGLPSVAIPGAVQWIADKPVQIMQYISSQDVHYKAGAIDPCMVLVPPVEQYGHNTTFKTAPTSANASFKEHAVSVYIKGPVDENNEYVNDIAELKKVLGSIEVLVNDKPLGNGIYADSRVESNRIPGTNYHFARFSVPPDATVHLNATTEMAGTAYGFGTAISYAWPTAMGLVQVGVEDTCPPVVRSETSCDFTGTDAKGSTLRPGTNQIDTARMYIRSHWADTVFKEAANDFENTIEDRGINRRPNKMWDSTNNLSVDNPLPMYFPQLPSGPPSSTWPSTNIKRGYVQYKIKNPYEDVFAHIMYEDAAGHTAVDEIVYIADKIRFYDPATDPGLTTPLTVLSFDKTTVGIPVSKTIVVKNINGTDWGIFETLLAEVKMNAGRFTITRNPTDKNTLLPGETIEITITYNPESESNVADLLCITTKCLLFLLPVNAGSGFPMIEVTNIDFGPIAVPNSSAPQEFTIYNKGTLELEITGATFTPAQPTGLDTFSFVTLASGTNLTSLPSQATPWRVAPGDSIKARLQFHALVEGPLSASLCFESNANPALDPNYNNCALLNGIGIKDGVVVSEVNFGTKRSCTKNVLSTTITNTGNFPIVLESIVGNAGLWKNRTPANNDTLFSINGNYFIVGVEAFVGDTLYPHDNNSYAVSQREFVLEVHFNPTSERKPYGNQDQTLEYTVNFEPTNGIPSIFGIGIIKGESILPKLDVVDTYTFPTPIKFGDTHNPNGTILVKNPSFTSATQIRSISIIEADQWEDFTITFNNSIETIGMNSEDSIIVGFSPQTATPITRICRFIIESDAWTCGTVDEIRYDTITLIGNTFDDRWQLNSPEFGTFARCDEQVLPITISNDGTLPLQIDSVVLEDSQYSNVLAFEREGITFPITVGANTPNEDLKFRFKGCNYTDDEGNPLEGLVTIRVRVYTNMGSQVATFTANPLFIPVELVLPSFETTPGLKPEVPIFIRIANTNNNLYNFANAKIGRFTIVLNVNHSQLHFENFVDPTTGWTYTVDAQTNNQVTITGYGNPLSGDGDLLLARPFAYVLVSTDGVIPISVESITFDRDCCLRWISNTGQITFDICAQVPRGDLEIASTEYSLSPVTPNPFTDKQLGINYSIGFDAKTTIQIFNSNGDLVKVAVDEYQKEGTYTADVNVGDLATGIYRITISSGQFEESQSLVIVR